MTGQSVRLWIDVTLVDGADPETAADSLFQLVAEDPDDVCSEIETVMNSGHEG